MSRGGGTRVLTARHERWALRVPFTISGSTMTDLDVVLVTVEQDGFTGRGEAAGVDYRAGESIPELLAQIEVLRASIEGGMQRDGLQSAIAPGGARNAIDCALWELDARKSEQAVWQLAGLPTPRGPWPEAR